MSKVKKRKKEEQSDANNVIIENHITNYLDKVGKVLFWMLLLLTIAEVITYILVCFGFFSYYLEKQNNIKLSYYAFIGESSTKLIITWLIFSFYLIIFQKVNFKHKKILLCTVLLLLTTILCFGHWKYSYLSILYSIPVVFTCPLGKKTQKIVLFISLIMSIFYSVLQYFIFRTDYNFFIGTVSVVTIVTFYLICSSFYNSMMEALKDVEKFYLLSAKLSDEISHDYVTGAFSKHTLHYDLTENKNFKSMAFIDLDNFKKINDTKGHAVGDHILKNIVRCFNSRRERIYRYGGDEFVILSNLSVENLATKIEMVKTAYNISSKKLFACDATFSAGVMPINHKDDAATLLQKCDEIMYISKHEGKNKISIKK